MPHLGSNTKSFYTIHRLYFSTRANVLDMIVRPLDSGTLTLHWVRVYKGDADRDTGNSSQDWVSWKYDEVWLREKKTTFWKHLKLPKEEGIKRLGNKIIHGRGQIIKRTDALWVHSSGCHVFLLFSFYASHVKWPAESAERSAHINISEGFFISRRKQSWGHWGHQERGQFGVDVAGEHNISWGDSCRWATV